MRKKFLEVGKIVSTHGLSGELKVEPWCDDGSFLCKFKNLYFDVNGAEKIKVLSAKVHKNIVLMKIYGVDSVEQAELLRGKVLFIDRNDVTLSKGEHFIQDILGLDVFDVDTNFCYGKITDVLKTGANDVYQITDAANKNYLVPAIKEVVCEVDIDNNLIKIRPMKGIFDDEN